MSKYDSFRADILVVREALERKNVSMTVLAAFERLRTALYRYSEESEEPRQVERGRNNG